MSDERDPNETGDEQAPEQRPDEDQAGDAPRPGDEDLEGLEGFEDLEGEEDPFGDLDPEELMRNPMGAINQLFSNPDAMRSFESFMSTPMAQQIMQQGLNSPMLQQMLGGNPMLQQMFGQITANLPPEMQQGPFPGAAAADAQDAEDDDELDEPVLDFFNPPHGGPIYPPAPPVATLDALLARLPEAAREPVRELAHDRLEHHLDARARARLDALAQGEGRGAGVDLLISQGAFAGELAWYAICHLEDDFDAEDFVPLARHALSCVTQPCGWCVPSFTTQLLAFLIELGEADDEVVRHATWALSGQPQDGREGIFEFAIDDLEELAAGLDSLEMPDDLRAAALIALLSWKTLGDARDRSLDVTLGALEDDAHKDHLLDTLARLLGGEQKIEGLRANDWSPATMRRVAERHAERLGVNATLALACDRWPLVRPYSAAHAGLLAVLDTGWADADADQRAAYFERLASSPDATLRQSAYAVGAAWEPHTYLEAATRDPDEGIQRWAQRELEAMR